MKVILKATLGSDQGSVITSMDVLAPQIAKEAKAGQFVALMVSEEGERIPLTIVDKDLSKGSIKLIFQEVGMTSKLLGKVSIGSELYAIVGPLGHPTEIKNYGNVIVVGGGVGIAEIYPVVKALKGAGNRVISILGARTKNLLILEKEMKDVSDEVITVTDDGSYGKKDFTTGPLGQLLKGDKYGLVYAVGPTPMMKKVCNMTKPFGIRTIVSLNALMVDATGMCGCCRITVGGKTKFSCVEGPEFDGHDVDWNELEKRSKIYDDKEKHICKLLNHVK